MRHELEVHQVVSLAGGLLTALAVLLPPAIYFGLSYQHLAGNLEAEAEFAGASITGIIAANPELWTFEQVRLAEQLARRPHDGAAEHRTVRDLDGRLVAQSLDPLPDPLVTRSRPLLDAGERVGSIEVARSLRPLLLHAGLLALALLPIALLAFWLLRAVPLRALRAGERALRRQRDAAQSYLDVAGVAFVRLDEGGRVVLVNRQAEAVLGRPAAEVLGREWVAAVVPPADQARVAAALAEVVPGQVVTVEHPILQPSGDRRILSWYVAPAADEAGRPGLLASGIDLTHQRALEQRLLHVQKLEAVGRLAGGVAHEFNNVLSIIRGYASALRRELGPGSPHRTDADEIVAATDRAATVARSLLAFSRRQPLVVAPLDLVGLVRGLERLLRPLLREDLRLELRLPDEPLPVLADPVQLEQVLLNLVNNARDAIAGPGKVVVALGSEALDEAQATGAGLEAAGRFALLTVSDDGPGIAPEAQERLFEPFFTTKPVGQGTGLGLSIVYGIVSQHHGAISVASAPGQGATFTIRLPLHQEEQDEPARGQVAAVAAPAGGRGQGETLLVAEDDTALRRLLRRILEDAGYRVVEAADGVEAVAQVDVARGRIALALLDVVMPGLDGRRALDRIRELAPGLPCLFVSGHPGELGDLRGIDLRGEQLLQKPVDREVLLEAVRRQLAGR
jgi:two-component system, cell cycle sensor histidine kinase and response regulator CckA